MRSNVSVSRRLFISAIYFCSWRSLCWSSREAKGREMSEARLGVDSLWGRCFWEVDIQVLSLEGLRRGLAEYGSPSLCCRVEASTGGGGSGESEADDLWEGAVVVCGTLDFLTWTEEGWSEDTCFSKDRIYRKTGGHCWKRTECKYKNKILCKLEFNLTNLLSCQSTIFEVNVLPKLCKNESFFLG